MRRPIYQMSCMTIRVNYLAKRILGWRIKICRNIEVNDQSTNRACMVMELMDFYGFDHHVFLDSPHRTP